MGLDMMLRGRKSYWTHDESKAEKIDGYLVDSVILDLGYWRKHPDLHGFIVQNYADGEDECQEIELTSDSMREIIAAVREDRLPHTEGFFFGSSEYWKGHEDEVIETFEKAIKWVEAERNEDKEFYRCVYYRASW